jgi:hypothetical protein
VKRKPKAGGDVADLVELLQEVNQLNNVPLPGSMPSVDSILGEVCASSGIPAE